MTLVLLGTFFDDTFVGWQYLFRRTAKANRAASHGSGVARKSAKVAFSAHHHTIEAQVFLVANTIRQCGRTENEPPRKMRGG